MPTITSKLSASMLSLGMFAAVSACTPGEPGSVNPASIGDGSSLTRADQRALRPAPTPALGTIGAPTAPSFGPGVGAELNTGIGVQRYNPLVP